MLSTHLDWDHDIDLNNVNLRLHEGPLIQLDG